MRTVAREASSSRLTMAPEEGVERLDHLLREAVACRMIADVPLGALLSGGIDSSSVVALMQSQSTRPVRTFSIGFWESGFDEARHAKAVAAHLGTDHTQLHVEPRHALDVIPRLPGMFDEPSADSSQIPTFLVSELARRDVKVALSGDGGDELFAGYSRYLVGDRLWRCARGIPLSLRKDLAWGVHGLSATAWSWLASRVSGRFGAQLCGGKILSGATLLSQEHPLAFYRGFLTHWDHPDDLVVASEEPRNVLWDDSLRSEFPDFFERSQLADSVTYLPDDILTKVDRASMDVSLETSAPLLDHRVLEFGWRLPVSLKIRDRLGKWILRQLLGRFLPQRLIDRPNMGFAMPIGAWLRGPLRDWAETLLEKRRLREDGIFDPAPIREAWSKHLMDEPGWGYRLWVVVMFRAWQGAQASTVVDTAA